MEAMKRVFVVLPVILSYLCTISALHTRGAVPLDSFTFDKVITRFPYTFVRFDTTYPHGDEHEEFKKVVEQAKSNEGLLVAEVGIADYGEKENSDLGDRYKVNQDDFPVYMLFNKDDPDAPIRHKGHYNADALKKFIRENTGLFLGLHGCMKAYDDIAMEFMPADAKLREQLIEKAEAKGETLENAGDKKSAEIYVKYMKKMADKFGGDAEDFVAKETKRVERLRDDDHTAAKKKVQLNAQSNILHSFSFAAAQKDEL
ncbi:PREDICTED: endoplasmic reticulum resident protein 29-like [Priapulus caudatus]|uniref:Endoplasmic reticulum resident protein 29-like n=1 Tax=Priapulus caudatus TaxID=37621 RepID=A0ABM1EAE4_PRICU|nr:PREDICTED: endoplasmic reticulum resident protein 29-like [Priapulus caudatus]